MSFAQEKIEKKVFDASCLKTAACLRAFYFTYLRKVGKKGGRLPLLFGTAMHLALERHYKGESVDSSLEAFDSLPSFSVSGDDLRTKDRGKAIFLNYLALYKKEDFTILHAETDFVLPFPGFSYSGRIDLVIRFLEQIYIMDHKTSGRSCSSYYFNYFRPDMSTTGYCYACKELMGECAGAQISVLSTARNPKVPFMRAIVNHTPQETEDWREEVIHRAETVIIAYNRWRNGLSYRKAFPRTTNLCSEYGGCPFRELCIYGDSQRFLYVDTSVHEKKE